MRILFLTPNIGLSGGIKTVLEYADFLARKGHKVTVLYPTKPAPSLRRRVQNFIRKRSWTKSAQFSSSFVNSLQVTLQRSKRTGALLEDDVPDADIVVATWWETAEWVNAFSDRKGLKVYFIQGHEIFEGLPQDRVKRTYAMPFRKIVVSRWLAEVMAREYADHSVKLVKNGVDTGRFHNKSKIRTQPFTVGMLYSSFPTKNAEMGISAIIEAQQSLPGMRSIIFGMEPLPKSIAGLAWIEYHYLPDRELIPEFYRRSHVWLFSSYSEGFGLPLLEAMASGTPVIATRAGAAPEIVDGHNGVLVDWDCKSMVGEILRLGAMDSASWLEMSRRARATAEENTSEAAASEFERVLIEFQSSK